jgi:hypothetical protein
MHTPASHVGTSSSSQAQAWASFYCPTSKALFGRANQGQRSVEAALESASQHQNPGLKKHRSPELTSWAPAKPRSTSPRFLPDKRKLSQKQVLLPTAEVPLMAPTVKKFRRNNPDMSPWVENSGLHISSRFKDKTLNRREKSHRLPEGFGSTCHRPDHLKVVVSTCRLDHPKASFRPRIEPTTQRRRFDLSWIVTHVTGRHKSLVCLDRVWIGKRCHGALHGAKEAP